MPAIRPHAAGPMSPLRAARVAAGLSQAALAKRLHLTGVTVHNWEADKCIPGSEWLAPLRRVLGAHLDLDAYLAHAECVGRQRAALRERV